MAAFVLAACACAFAGAQETGSGDPDPDQAAEEVLGAGFAEEVPAIVPLVTLGIDYRAEARDSPGDASAWSVAQKGELSLGARFGSAAYLEGGLSFDTSRDYSSSPLSPDEIIRQLYISFRPLPYAAFSVGKQRLSWGNARVFGSIDRLEALPDPEGGGGKSSLPGVLGLKADIIPTRELSLSLFAAPNAEARWSSLAIRLEALLGEVDAGLGCASFPFDRLASVRNPATASQALVRDRSRRWAIFADASWFGDYLGFYAESQAANARSMDWAYLSGQTGSVVAEGSSAADWAVKATAGAQADIPVWLDGTMRLLFEYHYDGEGFDRAEARGFFAAYRAARGEGMLLAAPEGIGFGEFGRNYLYCGASGIPLARKLGLSVGALVSIDSWFCITSTTLGWDAGSGVSLALSYRNMGQWFGDEPSEGELLGARNAISFTASASY